MTWAAQADASSKAMARGRMLYSMLSFPKTAHHFNDDQAR